MRSISLILVGTIILVLAVTGFYFVNEYTNFFLEDVDSYQEGDCTHQILGEGKARLKNCVVYQIVDKSKLGIT